MSLSRPFWYWNRLKAMDPAEIGTHVRKKWRQAADAKAAPDWNTFELGDTSDFPKLPDRAAAPPTLQQALRRDVDAILAGRWRAFVHLEITVDDPPRWQKDYLAGQDLETPASAFKLNHRQLPEGADIKLIWELSRWYQLVRLAQAAHVLDHAQAARKCVAWLQDWVAHNPPYHGWNWTSALEAGLRLVQFTWIDALLGPQAEARGLKQSLDKLRREILSAHVWFAWRYQSFGSSANNHLLGELAGLVLATVRWPRLARYGAPIEELQRRWEREVLAQFAEDGGNREQALNYQLFSWEFCWQVRLALRAAGQNIAPEVEQRLIRAARFFWEVQVRREPWDYGDSDNAYTTPFFASEQTALLEWRDWFRRSKAESVPAYWLDEPPAFAPPLGAGQPAHTVEANGWWIYPKSGIAVRDSGFWWLRWDLSPLGYLKTAAHGHLDALHLSMWFKGVAMIIDPGTGAYYADKQLRCWLASRSAHNGPCPTGQEYPQRLGPFLWAEHHSVPTWTPQKSSDSKVASILGQLSLPNGTLRRAITRLEPGDGWQIDDALEPTAGTGSEFTVRWQFGPGAWVKQLQERTFSINRSGVSLLLELSGDWAGVDLVESESSRLPGVFDGIVSLSFRKTTFAPCLKLTGRAGAKPCVFRTTFLASAPA